MTHGLSLKLALTLGLATVATPAAAAKYPDFGIGLQVGSEATYGNSITSFYRVWDYGEINWGLGYNSTGSKAGVGHMFILNPTKAIGLTFNTALVYSGGTDGDVEVDGTFTPEGSDEDESITAAKSYELSPAMIMGVAAGGYWDFLSWLRFSGQVCYNLPLSGNEVTLGKKITYEEDVEVTNEPEFEEEFDREAKREARAGGLGFSIGAAILF